jgi:lipooligosaccharide transport system ATP-binding protein
VGPAVPAQAAGVTLILTTHYMDEAEQLCDRLVVMDQARIVAEGSPRDLIAEHVTREVVELRFPVGDQEPASPRSTGSAKRIEVLPDRVLSTPTTATGPRRGGSGASAASMVVRRSTLEDVFLRLTGRPGGLSDGLSRAARPRGHARGYRRVWRAAR